MATLFKTGNKSVIITPKQGNFFSLKELQSYVDGLIEIVDLHNGQYLVINEDGKSCKELNEEATKLALLRGAIFHTDWIAGDAVLCDNTEIE